MDTNAILQSLDREIGNLQKAKEILAEPPKLREHPVKIAPKHKRTGIISPEGRKRIAAAQRKRWARRKAA